MQTAMHGVSVLIQDYDDHSFVFASLGSWSGFDIRTPSPRVPDANVKSKLH
jgi:hypothetical protein